MPLKDFQHKFCISSGWKQAFEVLAWAIALVLLARFLRGGTPPLRGFYLLALAVGFFRPWWGVSAVALLGPLSLLDPGKTHRLLTTEVLVLGAILGHLRSWRMGESDREVADESRQTDGRPNWRFWSVSVWIGVAAAALPGIWWLLGSPDFHHPGNEAWEILSFTLFGPATQATWTIRSLLNWTTGLLLAWVVARQVTPDRARFVLILGALGTTIACGVGLLDYVGLLSLEGWRADNPDLLRLGSRRLMGPAGHSGWFAEWIALTWPGLLMLYEGGRKRRAMVIAGLAILFTALLLTLARAGWLAAGVVGVVGWAAVRHRGGARAFVLKRSVLASAFVILAAALLLGGPEILERALRLTRIQDRWNYYVSTFHLLAVCPFGTGLGLHNILYESLFTPDHAFWQSDHVTAHSTWLHILVEQGAFQGVLVGVGAVAAAATAWRGYLTGEKPFRRIFLVLAMCVTGSLVDSLAQYLGYIRVVEVTFWVYAGMVVGLHGLAENARRPAEAGDAGSAVGTQPSESTQGLANRGDGRRVGAGGAGWIWHRGGVLLLASALAFGALTASGHARRLTHALPPRPVEMDPGQQGGHLWTERAWRFPVDPSWCGVEFTVLAKAVEQDVVIRAPGIDAVRFHLTPEERRWVKLDWKPKSRSNPFRSLHWLEVGCSSVWIPAEFEAGSEDIRSLGVYIESLRPVKCGHLRTGISDRGEN